MVAEVGKSYNRGTTRESLRDLNFRHLQFANLVLAGKTQTEAYLAVFTGGHGNPRRATEKASRLMARPDVSEYIERRKAKAATKATLSFAERQAILCGIAQDPDETGTTKVLSIRELNKMIPGSLAPERQILMNPDGSPVAPQVAVSINAQVPGISKREKILLWREQRALARQARATPAPLPASAVFAEPPLEG